MKTFFTMITMLAFCVSPAAFGAPMTADQVYKNTYIQIKQGADMGQVFKTLMESAKANKLDVKQVLEAAVAKGWMAQDQMNTVLDVAAKNANIAQDKDLVAKIQSNTLSTRDLQKLAGALEGQVTGAAYYCGYHGCYYRNGAVVGLLVLLVLIVILTPVYFVAY